MLLPASILTAVVLAHHPSVSIPSSPAQLSSLDRVPSTVSASAPTTKSSFHGYFVDVRDLRSSDPERRATNGWAMASATSDTAAATDAETFERDRAAPPSGIASGGAVIATPLGAVLRSGLNFEAPAETGDGASKAKGKGHWWSLHIAPGVSMLIFPGITGTGGGVIAGPSFRLGGHVHKFFDKFYIAGGPQMHYTGYFATGDAIHLATFGGDLFLGGGNEKIVGYGHIELGVGLVSFKDGQSNLSGTGLGGRLAVGGGLHGYITKKFSMGFLADFVVPYGLDLFLTMGIHFR